jgi:hypothetical protein
MMGFGTPQFHTTSDAWFHTGEQEIDTVGTLLVLHPLVNRFCVVGGGIRRNPHF